MPPPTPKLPFAPEGVPVIQPPPVTKSLQEAGGFGLQSEQLPALHEPKITSAPRQGRKCTALQVIVTALADWETICSLMITVPPPANVTVWFGWPLTAMLWPFTTKPLISAAPLVVGPVLDQAALARDMTKSAVTTWSWPSRSGQLVNTTLATLASDAATPACPIVVAWQTAAPSVPAMLPVSSAASCAPPEGDSGAHSARVTGTPRAAPAMADARPSNARLDSVPPTIVPAARTEPEAMTLPAAIVVVPTTVVSPPSVFAVATARPLTVLPAAIIVRAARLRPVPRVQGAPPVVIPATAPSPPTLVPAARHVPAARTVPVA